MQQRKAQHMKLLVNGIEVRLEDMSDGNHLAPLFRCSVRHTEEGSRSKLYNKLIATMGNEFGGPDFDHGFAEEEWDHFFVKSLLELDIIDRLRMNGYGVRQARS